MNLLRLPAILVCLSGVASWSLAGIIPEAADPANVAQYGTASVYEYSTNPPVTPVSAAIDLLAGDSEQYGVMTITGEWLGIEVALAGPTDLAILSALVDPAGSGNDPFKSTDSIEFLISLDDGFSFSSVGTIVTGTDYYISGTPNRLWLMSIEGTFDGVTNVRYRFHQADGGSEGQRIWEVMATGVIPEPCSAMLLVVGSLLACRRRLTSRRRRA